MTFSKNFITMTTNFLNFRIKSFSSLVIKAFWLYPRSHARIIHKFYSNHLMMMSENTHSWKCAFIKHYKVLLSFEKYISNLLNERMPLSSNAFIFLLILVLILKFLQNISNSSWYWLVLELFFEMISRIWLSLSG